MKVAVYSIAKNEARFVPRFMDSARDADEIIIADTGSDDGTVVAAGMAARSICITPWRFDHARNASLALISADVDVCICLDLDEVMEPGWREEIERVWRPETTRLRYNFDYSNGIRFKSEKIHARKGYFWKYACHEILDHDPRIEEQWAETDFQLIRHLPDSTKSRSHYLDLLKVTTQEHPGDLRALLYYGRELVFSERYTDAFYHLMRYHRQAISEWSHERAYALRLLAQCCEAQGDWREAKRFLDDAIMYAPSAREPLVDMASLHYRQKNWLQSLDNALKSLRLTDRNSVYTESADAWGYLPHDLIAIAAFNLGDRELAIEHGKCAVELNPSDERLRSNLTFYEMERAA